MKKITIVGLLMIVASVGLVAAAFNQTIQAPAPAAVNPNCATVTSTANPVPGTAGTLLFSCNSAATNGFTVFSTITSTPSFTLAAPFTQLNATASTCPGGSILTSGTAITLMAASYNYCAKFTNYPTTTPTAFSVSWS